MRLIAITPPRLYKDEDMAVRRLLDRGWERVHIRKPGEALEEVEKLIKAIPSRYYPNLSLHDHFQLAQKYSLGGIHLNHRYPVPPEGWQGMISRSCHSIEEIREYSHLDYLTLSPIFDSISKPGYHSRFLLDKLIDVPLQKVIALGGVTPVHLLALSQVGFAGAAMLSEAWKINNTMLQFITHTYQGLEEVLKGGCRWVQLRIKDVSDEEFAEEAKKVIPLCQRYGSTLIFDDRVELVAAIGADGVHLGKNDMPVEEARRLLGPRKIIGATANTEEEVIDAFNAGADYIGIGPFRFTATKKNLAPILGLDGYRHIMQNVRARGMILPVVAIGGIELDDIAPLRGVGIDGVAVSGLILHSADLTETTKKIVEKWEH